MLVASRRRRQLSAKQELDKGWISELAGNLCPLAHTARPETATGDLLASRYCLRITSGSARPIYPKLAARKTRTTRTSKGLTTVTSQPASKQEGGKSAPRTK